MKMTRFEKRFVNREKKSRRNIAALEKAFDHIDTGSVKTVLELGCGVGFVSRHLAETYNFAVYGTDYDDEQIQIAHQLQPKLDHLFFQIENAARLSFEDSMFDLVISQNVFHHIPNWQKAIQEIARVLRSDGYFIWLDITFSGMVKKCFLPVVKNYGLYTIGDIKTTLHLYEFNTLFFEHLSHGPFSQYHFVTQQTGK